VNAWRELGDGAERVSTLGQGTWELEHADERAAARALEAGLELGLTHVDTAEMYGDGRVEERLGRVLGKRRSELFLASKVLPSNASRAGTLAACERSLRRLRTERLDLYLLHWRGAHPLEDTLAAFEELRAAGKIRHYGVSNFDARELEEAVRLAGPGRIACNQVLYHLGERAVEHSVLPACRRLGVTLVAYSPFGGRDGFPGPRSRGGRALAEIAARHGVGARAVALAFLLRDERLVAIPKSADEVHVRANARALAVELEPSEVARLASLFPLGPEPDALPAL
jgi:diketogulonate reductase-like aldo/keto reductase